MNPEKKKFSSYHNFTLLSPMQCALREGLTIHLYQQLVEGILPLVMSPKPSCPPPLPPHGINLINEDDARSILPCLTEEVSHSCWANTNKHLQELGARDTEKGNFCLSSSGLSKHGLTRTRGTRENGSLYTGRVDI